jgi:hypothetical protein
MFRSLAGPTPRSCALSLPRDKRSSTQPEAALDHAGVTDRGGQDAQLRRCRPLALEESSKQRFFGQLCCR